MPISFTPVSGKKPGYKDLVQMFVASIEAGHLPAGSLLPPSRVLAESLTVSRDTIMRCYKHLQVLAYVESNSTRGTVVRPLHKLIPPAMPTANANALSGRYGTSNPDQYQALTNTTTGISSERLSDYGAIMAEDRQLHSVAPDFPNLNYGAVPPHLLPLRRWRELMQSLAQAASGRNLHYDMEVLGRSELREALAAYLTRAKGMACSPAHIAIFNITFSALSLLSRLLLNPGEVIAVEDPGFGGVKNMAAYHGFEIMPIPLDGEGLRVDKLDQGGKPIKLVYVSSSHQEPSGITMSEARRKELLFWAKEHDAWIIEDDYDGFFHYGGKVPPTLKSLDDGEHVIYVSTFWQLLYPLTTLCFAAVPPSLMQILRKGKVQTEGMTEVMVQLALADLLDSGYLQKHARKLERSFASKRRALIFALKQAFGRQVKILPQTGGVTCMAKLTEWSDASIVEAATAADLRALSTNFFYQGKRPTGEFLFYFPAFEDEEEVKTKIALFAAKLQSEPSANHLRERLASQD